MRKLMVQISCCYRFGMMENRNKTRLRRARWNQFAESPHLVSNAIYSWAGKQILPNGNLDDISTSDVSKPLEIAARYEVDLATNFSSMMVPLHFKLARFHTDRPEGKEPKVVSTVVAKVTEIKRLTGLGAASHVR